MAITHAVTREIRSGLRALVRVPGFTSIVVLILAVGTGATTALFSVVDGVLLRPLPVGSESRILVIQKVPLSDENPVPFQQADLLALAEVTRTLEDVAGVQYDGAWPYPARDGDRTLTVRAAGVSGEFFRVLRVAPKLGRLIEPADARTGAAAVAVISHGMWQRQYGGDAAVIGRRLSLNRTSVTIIGVAPPGLDYPAGTEAWVPLRLDPQRVATRDMAVFSVVGRLARGASLEHAQAELSVFLRARESLYGPGEPKGHNARLTPIRDAIVGNIRPTLLILFGSGLLVLVVVTVNLSTMLLVRSVDRRRELALRTALGASRGRILQQLLSEVVILVVAGTLLGVVIGFWGLQAMLAVAPPELPRANELGIDIRVLAFAGSLALLTMLVFAVGTAWWASSTGAHAVLRGGVRAGPDNLRVRLGKQLLVASQVAITIVVLTGANLLVRSLLRLERVDMGFAAEELTFASMTLQGEQYQNDARRLAFFEDVTARLAALPNVEAATAILLPPFSGAAAWTADYTSESQSESESAANPTVHLETVLPEYFATVGLPVLHGRGFTALDRANALPVAIVSEGFAARAWPGQDPVGKRLKFGSPTSHEVWMTVIGVVPETRFRDLISPLPTLYVPAHQSGPPPGAVVVRSTASADVVAALIRRAVAEVNPNERPHDIQTFAALLAGPLARPRFATMLGGGLAMIALLLATSGLYGLVAAVVANTEHEIGVRRALGARPSHVRRTVLGRILVFTACGTLAGLVLALNGARLLRSILFDTSPTDFVAITSAVVLLAITCVAACYFPVRRALQIDPARALRAE